MFRNPFDRLPPQVVRWSDCGPLRDVVIAVPIDPIHAVTCRAIVPTGDGPADWLRRSATTAIVTVIAVKARLAAETPTTD